VTGAPDLLDDVSTTIPSGPPSTFREFLVWLYRRFARATLTASTLVTTKPNGTAWTTQTVTDDGTTQTVGEPT
jgi:hypothetical protein